MILRNLLGLPIYDTRMDELIHALEDIIERNEKKTIFGISTGAIGRLKYRRDLGRLYKEFDINIAEGGGIPILGKLFGVKVSEKIGLVNLSKRLISLAAANNYKIQLFGSTDEIINLAEQNIKKNNPSIRLAKSINGYFSEGEIDSIIELINDESPDILFIGITYPIKERFAIKFKERLNVKLIIPCGGAFEVLAGRAKRPPFEFKYIPVAWFYRFIQEPIRLFKPILITALYTTFYVIPILYFLHITGIEKNPSITKFFNISNDEWDPMTGSITSS